MRIKWAILKCLEAVPTEWYNWLDIRDEENTEDYSEPAIVDECKNTLVEVNRYRDMEKKKD